MLAVRKAVEAAFPNTKKQISDRQYFTKSGEGNVPRYEHLALKYLSLPKEDWDVMGDNARKEYLEAKETEATPVTTVQTTEPFKLSAHL